jgi:hypothetical protein
MRGAGSSSTAAGIPYHRTHLTFPPHWASHGLPLGGGASRRGVGGEQVRRPTRAFLSAGRWAGGRHRSITHSSIFNPSSDRLVRLLA